MDSPLDGRSSAKQPLIEHTPHPTIPTSPPASLRVQYLTSLLSLLSIGSAYAFSSWAPDLKSLLSWTQSDMELLGYMGNLDLCILPFAAILTSRYPPSRALLPGAALILLGNLTLAFGVSQSSSTPAWLSRPPAMALANFVAELGIASTYISVVSVAAHNLPPQLLGKGLAVLVMAYGASSSLYALLYVFVLQRSLVAYFVVSGLLASFVCVLNAVTLTKMTPTGAVAALSRPLPAAPSSSSSSTSPAKAGESEEEVAQRLADGSFLSPLRVLKHVITTPQFLAYLAFMMTTAGSGYMVSLPHAALTHARLQLERR